MLGSAGSVAPDVPAPARAPTAVTESALLATADADVDVDVLAGEPASASRPPGWPMTDADGRPEPWARPGCGRSELGVPAVPDSGTDRRTAGRADIPRPEAPADPLDSGNS